MSPNACYSPLNGISHAGHITGVGVGCWDLGRKGIFKSEFSCYKTQGAKPRDSKGASHGKGLLKDEG